MLPAQQFAELFAGRTDAWGLGHGEVRRGALDPTLYGAHLRGEGSGLGIFPLTDDGLVRFAAIDLDEPDFEAARKMGRLLPGRVWIERSRRGRAHVWAFFAEPIEAWIPRGIMRLATVAAGKPRVEVFPKQDVLSPGVVGNYINLPYHGFERPVLFPDGSGDEYTMEHFVAEAHATRNDPAPWRQRARILGIETPADRDTEGRATFGEAPSLHLCATHILQHRFDNPVRAGHRSVVYFSVAKQLLNYRDMTEREAWDLLVQLEAASPDRISEGELRRIFRNAASGRYTSTGCDDPLMADYVHPDCPIAKGASR